MALPSRGLAKPLGHPATLIATWFGVGLLPGAPGTWGSLAALPVGWVFVAYIGHWQLVILAAALFAAGLWATRVLLDDDKDQDPGAIVIDEVAAQLLVLAVAAADVVHFLAAFVFFRIADVLKPWPVSWADRRIKGAFGVMFDDVLAAAYAALILYLLRRFWEG